MPKNKTEKIRDYKCLCYRCSKKDKQIIKQVINKINENRKKGMKII